MNDGSISLEKLCKDTVTNLGFDAGKLLPEHVWMDDDEHPRKIFIHHPDAKEAITIDIARPGEEFPEEH